MRIGLEMSNSSAFPWMDYICYYDILISYVYCKKPPLIGNYRVRSLSTACEYCCRFPLAFHCGNCLIYHKSDKSQKLPAKTIAF